MPYKIPIIIGATIASIAFTFYCGWIAGSNHKQLNYEAAMQKANDQIHQQDIKNANIAFDSYQKQLANKDYYNNIFKDIAKDETKNNNTDFNIDANWVFYCARCTKKSSDTIRAIDAK